MSTARPLKTLRKFTVLLQSPLKASIEPDQEELLVLTAVYNEKGFLLSEARMDIEGGDEEVHSYRYNDQGYLTEHLLEIPADGIMERFVTIRNSDGLPLEITKYYGEEPGEKTSYTYGAHAQPVRIVRYDADGVFEEEDELLYDDQARMISRIVKNAEGQEKAILFTYDENGRLVKEEERLGDDIVSVLNTEYDQYGREVWLRRLNAEGKMVSAQESQYDEVGRLVRRTTRGFYTRISTYTYNEAGQLAEESLSDENGFVISRNRMEYNEDGQLSDETVYETDLTRAGRDTHLANRYEYEYF